MAALIARSSSGVAALLHLEVAAGKRFGTSKRWREVLTDYNVIGIVSASHAAPVVLPALQTATNMGLKTIVINNSWKDVYTHLRVPITPTRMVVWSQQARKHVLGLNRRLNPEHIAVMPSLHLEPFIAKSGLLSREELCGRLGLNPGRPFVCYTTASPAAVRNEERIVQLLVEAVEKGELPGKPQLLIRVNPMDERGRYERLFGEKRGVVVHKPAWEWEPASDWCCALPSDSAIWLSTVYHSALNVSIPSTVTFEFRALGKPVINICFDIPAPLEPSASNRRFWDAPFYKEVRERQESIGAFSGPELLEAVGGVLSGERPTPGRSKDAPRETPVQRAVALLQEALGE